MSIHSNSFLITVLLALILCALAPRIAVSQTSAICYPCLITACGGAYNSSNFTVQLPANSTAAGAQSCATFAYDLAVFTSSALGSACQQNIAQFACQTLALINSSETACNASTIGQGTAYGSNATLFSSVCAQEVRCLGYAVESELIASNACSSFYNFYSAVIATPTPSALTCQPCNITACYNTSALTGVPGLQVSFASGSLPGVSGYACPAQNAVATALISNPLSAATQQAVIQATCGPLAQLAIFPNQAAQCQIGNEDLLFDQIVFAEAAAYNQTWQSFCLPSLQQVFSPTIVANLTNAGYCLSPHNGLINYGNALLALQIASSSSSSSGAFINVSSSSTAQSGNDAPIIHAQITIIAIAIVSVTVITLFY